MERNGIDLLLASLVGFVHESGASVPITLTVGGLIISGQLVSEGAYQDALGELVGYTVAAAASDDPDAPDSYAGNPVGSRFVHLKGARVLWDSGVGLSQLDILWRGQLSHVDGWWIGQLTDSSSGVAGTS